MNLQTKTTNLLKRIQPILDAKEYKVKEIQYPKQGKEAIVYLDGKHPSRHQQTMLQHRIASLKAPNEKWKATPIVFGILFAISISFPDL
jgi:hypothetical protein